MPWLDKLALGRTLLIDGGTGTELERRGVPVDPIIWMAAAAVTHFDVLVCVHEDFIAAGADIITANTFATNRFVLEAGGWGQRFRDLNERAVAAAQQAVAAANRPVAVAGSMSCLPPAFDTANYPARLAATRAYREHANCLADLGVDLIVLEMLQDTHHAVWALEAALATGLPVWAGISCRPSASGDALVGFDTEDVTFQACLEAIALRSPAMINIMHSPCSAIDRAIATLEHYWHGPFGVYPEVGSFDAVRRKRTSLIAPEELAAHADRWRRQGACLLGGCCGARPEHIATIAATLAAKTNRE
jgi:S-methylmethionine-dependent homocysteine/selenocysteine methylase